MSQAFWITGPGECQLQPCTVEVLPGTLEIETLFSAISRGTERLVFEGRVPFSEHATMRAPFQDGDFTFPIKYGYAAVGRVINTDRAGDTVFSLYPHQSRFAVPAAMALPVPDHVPAARAVLAANMETALNIIWDAELSAGDRVVVIGCGVVGALTGYLAAGFPGTEVTLIDVNKSRAPLAAHLGCAFTTPEAAPQEADVVIHTSATESGLAKAVAIAGFEARIVEASWFGAATPAVPLGGPFHQRRLQIVSSQVGRIPAHRAPRWDYRRRLSRAISLLADDRLDALTPTETAFSDLPGDYAAILSDPGTLCHRIRYDH